jgi:hypothetical protein
VENIYSKYHFVKIGSLFSGATFEGECAFGALGVPISVTWRPHVRFNLERLGDLAKDGDAGGHLGASVAPW